MVKAFHGKKPDENPMAYDVQQVIKFVGPQVRQ